MPAPRMTKRAVLRSTFSIASDSNRGVQRGDIDRALQKISGSGRHVQNYIFITTEPVTADIREYARSTYDETGGIEIDILDCLGFQQGRAARRHRPGAAEDLRIRKARSKLHLHYD